MLQRFLDPGVLAISAAWICWRRRWWTALLPDCTARRTSASARSLRSIAPIRPGTICGMWTGICLRGRSGYLKRYRGETNSQLTILLDASNSMELHFEPGEAEQDGLCAVCGGFAVLSGDP